MESDLPTLKSDVICRCSLTFLSIRVFLSNWIWFHFVGIQIRFSTMCLPIVGGGGGGGGGRGGSGITA